ncbi:MAG: AAC(3) family N-acetyltransferase [Anaerolineales bacterium]|nr:AAC(3) family N-acetyltransferase [Anaerolineales bacterium]MCB9146031.1 AAC(3) family N-acetyltransferase [Anaerolineales bacterium]
MLTKKQLIDGFGQIGIKNGDTVIVHTSYKSLGGVEGGADSVIDAFIELAGKDGTVMFPAFNFQSWTETHYFDVKETPSKMGAITEIARLRPNALRTPHPIYSFSVTGARAEEFSKADDVEAYGPNSAFALFHKINGTIVSIGLDFNSTFSMHHYIEYNVGCNYRRVKEFAGIYLGYDRVPKIKMHSMFVRNNERVKTYIVPGMNELLEAGVIREVQVGAAKVHHSTANEFYDNMSVIVREHPEKLHYIEEPKY